MNHFHNQQSSSSPSPRQNGQIVDLRGVSKSFKMASGDFFALNGIDLQIDQGEFVAIVGKSGSGKSTLLNIVAGIDQATSGEVIVAGTPVHTLNENRIAIWRGENVGVVFQFFQLLPTLTVIENVMLPMLFCSTYPASEREARAMQLLEQVGIADQAAKFPALLSGGQQQRAAIARALANDPPVILADEPTGNLDSQTADDTLQLFKDLSAAGKTVVIVTHERDVAAWVSRTVTLADGRIVDNTTEMPTDGDKEMQAVSHA